MNVLQQFKNITCLVFDMDGVLTDGKLLLLADGQMARSMHIKDGYAMQLAIKKGFFVCIISGSNDKAAGKRLRKLGIKDVYFNVEDKVARLQKYINSKKLSWEQVLYMGDDIPDTLPLQMAGLASCPQDAVPEIKAICAYISDYNGGEGCVRDVIEKTLKLNESWQ